MRRIGYQELGKLCSAAVWKRLSDVLITARKMKDEIQLHRSRERCAIIIHQSLTESKLGFYRNSHRAAYSVRMDHQYRGDGVPALPNRVSVGQALLALLRHPWRSVVLRWNGKAALLSALFRGIVFLAASINRTMRGAGAPYWRRRCSERCAQDSSAR